MIDVEYEIDAVVLAAINAERTTDPTFPSVDVTGTYVKEPATLPHVSIIEADNYVDRSSRGSDDGEHMVVLTYEVNVYTSLATGKKHEAKRIMKVVDDAMLSMNFRRIAMQPLDNMMDATVYRLFARYQVNVDKTGKMYRR